jgi:excisionase family DNA binding protein
MPFAAEEFLTVAEVARGLRVANGTEHRWIELGTLPAPRFGRRVRIAPL